MRIKVEEELAWLVKMEVIEPVQFANWAAPVVPISKRDKTVRLCGDFKITVNPLDRHPIPRVEVLLASLAGGTLFTKLDLSNAYQQVKLDETSKQFVIINTSFSLYASSFWSFISSWDFSADNGIIITKYSRCHRLY